MTEISLEVEGLPPAKDSSTSIFNQENRHHQRVISLLKQVQQALKHSQWNPTERRVVGLELVITDATMGIPGDAINYLGGVADVLQANRRNTDLSHIHDLAQASLYFDDRQVRDVRYYVEEADIQTYRVRVWILSDKVN